MQAIDQQGQQTEIPGNFDAMRCSVLIDAEVYNCQTHGYLKPTLGKFVS